MQESNSDQRQSVIDENLRRVYEKTVEEGIPDRFKDLLNQLKEQDNKTGTSE